MFEGELGKQMMIEQGYVPATCLLPIETAGPLIWQEVNAGRSPCDQCHCNRVICKGRPPKDGGNPFAFGVPPDFQACTSNSRSLAEPVVVRTGNLKT